MIELMEGYVKEGTVGLDHTERWHSDTLSFFGGMTSASSVNELLQVCSLSWFPHVEC